MRPTVLLFHLSEEKCRAVQSLAESLQLRALPVPPELSAAPLAEILTGTAAPAPTEPLEEEMLVLANVPNVLMDLFLKGLRQQHTPVALKAVLTPTNETWTPARLQRELGRERDALAAGRAAHRK